ncbi:MAG: KAP family NTPase [Bacteroidales bacterium]|nr:KAP family NTPase [Bacteroidales bacterium]
MTTTYQPPKTIWEVYSNINYNNPLESDDPKYVKTEKGRGDFSFSGILKHLNVHPKEHKFLGNKTPSNVYIAFCGHRGCGKSTELTRLASELDKPGLFKVVFLESARELDPNNTQYPDIFMSLASRLLSDLGKEKIKIKKIHYERLENWFWEKVIVDEDKTEYAADLIAGAKAETGIPFLVKIFAKITTSIKDGSTYKETLRNVIKNNFTLFAEAFNNLLAASKVEIAKKLDRKEILFIIDDLEKLRKEEADNIFIDNVNQLQQINSNFIYAAPIDMLYAGMQLQQFFKTYTLPMIKAYEKDGTKCDKGYSALRDMLFRYADESLFSSDEVVKRFITFSGGNPRHLLQLLEYAYINSESESFDSNAISKAVKKMATDFEKFLENEDYGHLYKIDNSLDKSTSDKTRFLLRHLALLEYNEYWRKSHPAVRELDTYKKLACNK